MTRRLTFRPQAEADLAAIWDHTVANWSVTQAERYLSGLNDTLSLLCDHPEIARLQNFAPPMRLYPYRAHLLVFSADERTLEVVRLRHMRSNWRVLLSD